MKPRSSTVQYLQIRIRDFMHTLSGKVVMIVVVEREKSEMANRRNKSKKLCIEWSVIRRTQCTNLLVSGIVCAQVKRAF